MARTVVTDRVQIPIIKLDGTELVAAEYGALAGMRVERSLWMPSRAVIRLDDHDFTIVDSAKFAVGKALKVSTKDVAGSPTEVFDGEITDLTVEQNLDGHHQLVVGAMDKGHRLAVATNLRTFAKKKYSDIASTVATGAGLTTDITATTAEIPYVVQTVNDYAFLWEIARKIGYDWWIDSGKLSFKPSPTTAGPTLTFGDTLTDFRVRYSGVVKASKITVQGWDPDTQKAVTGNDESTLTGSAMPAIGSDAPFATEGRTKAKAGWDKEYKTGAFPVTTTTEAQTVAKSLALQADATEVFARGKAMSTPALVPGKAVKIANMGAKVSGSYYVTTVEHSWGDGESGVQTRFTAGNKQPVGLADLVGGGGNADPSWGTSGLVVGVVTNVKDEEGAGGRVKVKFPTLSDADESDWARVISPGAGPERGLEFMPEVNDEVIVGFEQGDFGKPLVLGGVWSKKNKPPFKPADATVKSRTIKTRLGHTIEMMDGDDDATKAIVITLADGATTLNLAQDKVELVANKKALKIESGDASIAFDTSGNITISGNKITLDAGTGDVALSGNNVKADAKMGITLASKGPFKAEGALANLESKGITTVKGSMVKIN